MRDFQEFINGKMVVYFANEEELMTFLKVCEDNGLHFGSKKSKSNPTECMYFLNEKCGLINGYVTDSLGFNTSPDDYNVAFERVPASEFLQPQTTIEIFQSKQTVVCLKKQGGKVVARGVARCSKNDEFNFDYGSTLAFKRMLVDSKNKELMKDFVMPKSDYIQGDAVDAVLPKIKTLKDGTKIIKQDFYEVGDKVLIKKKPKDLHFIPKKTANKHCGKIREVSQTYGYDTFEIKEDDEKWDFYVDMVKGRVIE